MQKQSKKFSLNKVDILYFFPKTNKNEKKVKCPKVFGLTSMVSMPLIIKNELNSDNVRPATISNRANVC